MKVPTVSKTHRQKFKDDGVVLVRNLFDETKLRLISAGIEKCLSHPSKRHADYANDSDSLVQHEMILREGTDSNRK